MINKSLITYEEFLKEAPMYYLSFPSKEYILGLDKSAKHTIMFFNKHLPSSLQASNILYEDFNYPLLQVTEKEPVSLILPTTKKTIFKQPMSEQNIGIINIILVTYTRNNGYTSCEIEGFPDKMVDVLKDLNKAYLSKQEEQQKLDDFNKYYNMLSFAEKEAFINLKNNHSI